MSEATERLEADARLVNFVAQKYGSLMAANVAYVLSEDREGRPKGGGFAGHLRRSLEREMQVAS